MKVEKKAAIGPDSISESRNRLADFSLIIFAILGLPAIIISLLRIREFGWLASMYVHLGVYLVLVALFFFRGKLTHHIKAGVVLILLFVLGTGSFPTFATAGSGVFFYLAIVVLGTLFYGFRGGLASFVLCLAGLIAAMIATMAGYIDPKVDLNLYALSVSSWTAKIAVFTLLGGLCLGLMSLMQRWLEGSLGEMELEIQERRLTESRLENSLAEKEILLREIHHRVKSNLQVVMNLLDLHIPKSGTHEDNQVLVDSRNRLRVIAQIHEHLYSSGDLTNIDFSSFLEKLATGVASSFGADSGKIELDLQLEPCDLVVDTAIPCGLIVNELLSNSMKYAFQGRDTGSVSIEFSRVSDDQYRLVVADDGVGFIPGDIPEKDLQLGMKLIEALSKQLEAETTLTTDSGTVFTMLFREYREVGSEMY